MSDSTVFWLRALREREIGISDPVIGRNWFGGSICGSRPNWFAVVFLGLCLGQPLFFSFICPSVRGKGKGTLTRSNTCAVLHIHCNVLRCAVPAYRGEYTLRCVCWGKGTCVGRCLLQRDLKQKASASAREPSETLFVLDCVATLESTPSSSLGGPSRAGTCIDASDRSSDAIHTLSALLVVITASRSYLHIEPGARSADGPMARTVASIPRPPRVAPLRAKRILHLPFSATPGSLATCSSPVLSFRACKHGSGLCSRSNLSHTLRKPTLGT